MSYTKQEFKSGDKLYASQLNAMDEQIALNASTIADKATLENGVIKFWKTSTEESGTDTLLYSGDLNELGKTGYLDKKYDFTIGDVDENGNFVQGSGNMARTDKLSFDDFKEVKFASSFVYLFVCEYDSNNVYKGLIADTVKSFTLIPKEHYKYVIKVWYGASDILSKNDIKILAEVDESLEKKTKCYIDLPSKMFIEKGKSLELFKYGMFYCDKGYQPQEFNVRVVNIDNYATQYSDKIIINCPSNYSDTTLRNSSDLPLFQLLDTYGKVIDQKRVTIYVADKSMLENTTRRIAYFGDSFTGMGYRTQGIAELINNETNLSNTKLIGKFIGQGTDNRFTGTGGYSWANYTENPSSLPSSYPNNYLWDSTYNIINTKKFVEDLGETQLDCVFILLGWNDYESGAFSSSFSWDTMKQRAKRLIENIHHYYPSCKIVLESYHYMYPHNRTSYGSTLPQTRHNKYIYELNKFYQSIADEYLYVEFLQMSYLIDVLHNMPMEEKTVNKRSTEKEKYCTDVVHPSVNGFYQYSDAEFATMINLLS